MRRVNRLVILETLGRETRAQRWSTLAPSATTDYFERLFIAGSPSTKENCCETRAFNTVKYWWLSIRFHGIVPV